MEQELREKLKEVNNNTELSIQEKIKFKRDIVTSFYKEKNTNVKNQEIICTHYPNKKCDTFFFSCCSKKYECVRCHKENEDHPFKLESIQCKECKTNQSCHHQCIKCNTQFSTSYCEKCGLFSNEEHIYHCDKCGICRVGKEEELIHCDKCDMCFLKSIHVCKENEKIKKNCRCCFCNEDIYGSMDAIYKLSNCNHYSHIKCAQQSLRNKSLKCGLCRKTFLKKKDAYDIWRNIDIEIENTHIPLYLKESEIYKTKYGLFVLEDKTHIRGDYIIQGNHNQHIVKGHFYEWKMHHSVYLNTNELKLTRKSQCNDCSHVGFNIFHIVGIKCQNCNGYNVS